MNKSYSSTPKSLKTSRVSREDTNIKGVRSTADYKKACKKEKVVAVKQEDIDLSKKLNTSVQTLKSEHRKPPKTKQNKTKPAKSTTTIKLQTGNTIGSECSDNSSVEKPGRKGPRKDRKPLPLVFEPFTKTDNSDGSSVEDTSEDFKEEGVEVVGCSKCTYLGDRETLRSFWDKCHYDCFKSKRCVAGEKPKRKYRKKPKAPKPATKKRKFITRPLSCIDTSGTAVANSDYLSRYEMLLFMDPLDDAMAPWQKEDFEKAFRMVKPSELFAHAEEIGALTDNDSTDYTNSDTDKEVYD